MSGFKNQSRKDTEFLLAQDEIYKIKKKVHKSFENNQSNSIETNSKEANMNKINSLPQIFHFNENINNNNGKNQENNSFSSSCLQNLISKSKNRTNGEEIDLFEDESKTAYRNVELENYWVFLKGNKNILVIPIEDEEIEMEDRGLWKFPLNELEKLQEQFKNNLKSKKEKEKDISKKKKIGDNDQFALNKIKWRDCSEMKIPWTQTTSQKKPKFFNLD